MFQWYVFTEKLFNDFTHKIVLEVCNFCLFKVVFVLFMNKNEQNNRIIHSFKFTGSYWYEPVKYYLKNLLLIRSKTGFLGAGLEQYMIVWNWWPKQESFCAKSAYHTYFTGLLFRKELFKLVKQIFAIFFPQIPL